MSPPNNLLFHMAKLVSYGSCSKSRSPKSPSIFPAVDYNLLPDIYAPAKLGACMTDCRLEEPPPKAISKPFPNSAFPSIGNKLIIFSYVELVNIPAANLPNN